MIKPVKKENIKIFYADLLKQDEKKVKTLSSVYYNDGYILTTTPMAYNKVLSLVDDNNNECPSSCDLWAFESVKEYIEEYYEDQYCTFMGIEFLKASYSEAAEKAFIEILTDTTKIKRWKDVLDEIINQMMLSDMSETLNESMKELKDNGYDIKSISIHESK